MYLLRIGSNDNDLGKAVESVNALMDNVGLLSQIYCFFHS